MFDRLGALKCAVLVSLSLGSLVNGVAFATEVKTEAKVEAKVTESKGKEEILTVGDKTIVFVPIGPNEQVISMDTLTSYRNLHQNMRRRSISLTDRRRASTDASSSDGEVVK